LSESFSLSFPAEAAGKVASVEERSVTRFWDPNDVKHLSEVEFSGPQEDPKKLISKKPICSKISSETLEIDLHQTRETSGLGRFWSLSKRVWCSWRENQKCWFGRKRIYLYWIMSNLS